ncbi:MAG TPA: hypothetical protein VIK04_05905 [Solirubrobacteraceae bacterium]
MTTVLAALVAGIAGAAAPVAGGAYRGSLPDGLNNGYHWNYAPNVTGTADVRISAGATKIARFSGSYFYYCGAGRSTLTGHSIAITARGTFYTTAKRRARYGIDYYMLSGRFLDHGRKLAISYLADFASTGEHVTNPYSTVFRQGPCESWVHGTLNVTR